MTKEQLLELIGHRNDALNIIRNILAENGISDKAYAQIFQLLYYTLADGQDHEVAYCKETKEWRMGKTPLSDLKLFCLLGRVHEVVRYYVLSSWDDCILSSWITEMPMLDKIKADMLTMENLTHLRSIFKIAVETMIYSSDSSIAWESDSGN